MSGIDLKPCPFCGGKAKVVKTYWTIYIKCQCCDARSNCKETEQKAAEAWNRRVGDTDV